MFTARQNIFLYVLTFLITESYTITCGPREYESVEDSSEYNGSAVMEREFDKPLQPRKMCNLDWSRTYETESDGYIPVNCGRCTIYNLSVQAKRKTTFDHRVCWGLTPELFTSRMNCMWKNSCHLRYATSDIVWTPQPNIENPDCLGEEPGTVDVGYSCLDPETPIHDVLKGYQAIDSIRGLVRSHKYNQSSRVTYKKNLDRYILDISPPADLRTSWKNYFMMLYVITSEIHTGDKLTLHDITLDSEDSTDKCEISTWRNCDTHNVSFSTARFEFNVKGSSEGAGGFDICFQWFNTDNLDAKTQFEETVNLCKKSTGKKDGVPAFDVIKESVSREPKGMIRSHSKYPWNYKRPIVSNYDEIRQKRSSQAHVLLAPTGFNNLKIQVKQIELGRGDGLLVTSGSKKVSDQELSKTSLWDFSGQNVTLNFSVLHIVEHTSYGFLLCYQWYKPTQLIPKSTDLCDQFAYKADPCFKKAKKLLKQKCDLKKPKQPKKKQTKKDNKGIKLETAKEGSKTAKEGSKTAKEGSKTAKEGSKTAKEGSKTTKEGSKGNRG